MDIDRLIEDMKQDLAKKTNLFGDKVYRDEPIIKRASAIHHREPPEYAQMRKLGVGFDWSLPSECLVFYEQARFMRDFEDDYAFDGTFSRYFPTYRVMTLLQLRGYFSWRTKVRRGVIEPTAFSFPFVYCYELLMLIGAENETDAYQKLIDFGKAMENVHFSLSDYVKDWLADFAVYYHLPKEEFLKYADIDFDRHLGIFVNARNESDDALFPVICALSSYDIGASPFFEANAALTRAVVCRVIREQITYYETHRRLSFPEKLFGKITAVPYTMFSSAVFYDARMYEDYTYKLCDLYQYTCRNGVWRVYRATGKRGQNDELGLLLKNTEAVLREATGFVTSFMLQNITKTTEKSIRTAVAEEIERQKNREARTVTIDFSLLNAIREAAEQTKEKLMTEEERDTPVMPPTPVEEEIKSEPAPTVSSDNPLNAVQTAFLRLVLDDKTSDAVRFAKEQKLTAAILSDAVNEKLFDEYADNVIDFISDMPYILDDYKDDLKERYLS